MDVKSTKAADDAFFAQLLADLEHDGPDTGHTDPAGAPPAPSVEEEDVWTLDFPPPAPSNFTSEDRTLRASLVAFYKVRNPANLQSVNEIVETYRGTKIWDLWAQLAVKYQVPPAEAVALAAKTLYLSGITTDVDLSRELGSVVDHGGLEVTKAYLYQLHNVSADGGDVRHQRALCWKLLLGYLPTESKDWPHIQEQRRETYRQRRKEWLRVEVSTGCVTDVLTEDARMAERMEALKEEVEQTVQHFQHQVNQSSLLSIMALFLVQEMPLVQGMTHIAAVLLYVFSLAVTSNFLDAEADAFWCFSALVAELRTRLDDVQRSTAMVHHFVGSTESLLSKYDSSLAQHFSDLGFEPGVVCLRWFLLLFAKDINIHDLVLFFDAFLADERKANANFELPGYVCLSLLMEHHDELLDITNVLDLVELIQQLPGKMTTDPLGQRWEDCFSLPVLRRAWAIRGFEARSGKGHTPPFPTPSTVEVVQGVAGAFFSGIFSNF